MTSRVLDGDRTDSTPVLLSRAELARLQTLARQLENLRRNLLRGGVEEETLDMLSQDDPKNSPAQQAAAPSPSVTNNAADDEAPLAVAPTCSSSTAFFNQPRPHNNRHRLGQGYGLGSNSGANYAAPPQDQKPPLERQCFRSVALQHLAEGTTHGDITAAIRGGLLLDIYLPSHGRSATVSFLHAADARNFIAHVRKHDLYIWCKRIEAKHGEDVIREDLKHIHNLVVVKVDHLDADCRISLNSVHNAVFARTCMMSRLKYKGIRIDWDVDQCSLPYELISPGSSGNPPPPRNASAVPTNRFHLLRLDDKYDDDVLDALFEP